MNKITIIRGDDTTIDVTFRDEDGAINLTGATVYFTAKQDLSLDDDSASISKDITSHTEPEDGKTQIVLTSTDTNIKPGVYFWDLQIKTSGGATTSTRKGELEILQDVTRR